MIDQGVTIVSVARDLGVGEALLGRWVTHERERRQAEETGTPTTAQLHAEIAWLRADDARLAMENEFLEEQAPSLPLSRLSAAV